MIEVMPGIIVAVNGTNPGPASGITYDIEYRGPNGMVRINGITPSGSRYPDELHTIAAPVGTPITVHSRAGTLYLIPPGESFEIEECEEPEA